ncbi:MAG: hypothetical protein ABI405_09680 [Parafilimonas sp.]
MQNLANPFKNNTGIFYTLKNKYKNVQIVVAGNSGKAIKVMAINNQSANVIFSASLLSE